MRSAIKQPRTRGTAGERGRGVQASSAARVAGLVLAAGRSTRMGHNKLLATLDDVPLVARAVDAALSAGLAPVCVVTGHESEAVVDCLRGRSLAFAHNPEFARGLGSSLAAGVRALGTNLDGVVVLLGDMPHVSSSHLLRLIEAFERAGRRAICVPEHAGQRGNPVLWPAEHFAALMRLDGDTGGRGLLQQYAERVVKVSMPDRAVLEDVDSPEELAALSAARPAPRALTKEADS